MSNAMSKPERPWCVPVSLHEIPETGRRYDLSADENIRAAIGKVAGVQAVPTLTASFEVMRHGSQGLHVIGSIVARVGQPCVVTLEPMENAVEENIDLVFVPPPVRSGFVGSAPDGTADAGGDDAPEVLVNGTVDLGAIATEFFLLAIDPYPRKTGVVFAPASAGDDAADHPFAALAALKPKKGANDG
jgi:uncharacterized metal-binding protein YceD (DUF177 family)